MIRLEARNFDYLDRLVQEIPAENLKSKVNRRIHEIRNRFYQDKNDPKNTSKFFKILRFVENLAISFK